MACSTIIPLPDTDETAMSPNMESTMREYVDLPPGVAEDVLLVAGGKIGRSWCTDTRKFE